MHGSRHVSRSVGGVLVVLLAFTTGAPLAASAQAGDRDAGAMEAVFVARVNSLRAEAGLAPFSNDTEIRSVAQNWTVAMADAGRISHNPNLGSQVTAPWQKLGENVGTGGNAESVEDAFEASPGHRRNILDAEFTSIAVTVIVRGERIYVTQQFRLAPTPKAPVTTTPKAVPNELALVSPSVKSTASVAARMVPARGGGKKHSNARRPVRLT